MERPTGPYCQSCGMPMSMDANGGGTNADGSASSEYCSRCWQNGAYVDPNLTLEKLQTQVDGYYRQQGASDEERTDGVAWVANLSRWSE